MKKAMSTYFSKSGTHAVLLLMALLLMSMLPKSAAAQLDLSRLMAIDDGITVEDQSTGSYQWTESTKEGCMPGLMSTNPGASNDQTVSTLTMQITSEKDFQLSFDYQLPAAYNRYLKVAVDGFLVVGEEVYGQKGFSLPIVAGTHQVSISYYRNRDGSSDDNYACIYNMKISTTIDTPTEKRPMAVFNRTDKTFTFYYDTKVRLFGENVPVEVIQIINTNLEQYWSHADWTYDVKTIVFDPSFKEYLPKSLYYWFWYFIDMTSVSGIENLNTSETTILEGVFSNCYNLKSLDLSSLDTRKAENCYGMFSNCSSLEYLNLSGFNTEACYNMNYMFRGCSSLKELDLSSFNTANVYNMSQMFKDCSSLQTIYVSDDFNTDAVTYSDDMFSGCTSLKGAKAYDSDCTDAAYANYEMGYFTKGCLHTDDAGNPTWTETESHEATCVEGAYKVYTCSICHRTKREYTSAPNLSAHSITKHEPSEPTCGTDGNKEYYACDICKRVWLDAALTMEPTDESEYIIRRTGHVLDNNGDCTQCHQHAITLNGVTAEFHNIAKTSWNILNDEANNRHGLTTDMSDITSLAMTLTSDKDFDFDFKYEGTNVAPSFIINGDYYDPVDMPTPYRLKAGVNKVVMGVNNGNSDANSYCHVYDITATTETSTQPATESCGKLALDLTTGVATIYSNDKAPAEGENLSVASLPEIDGLPDSPWFSQYAKVKKIVFDESFKSVKPKTTAGWFAGFYNCLELSGLENLDLSEATSTAYMFAYCSGVPTLDLTAFNTTSVKDMRGMFLNCTSLTTIYASDLFSTANVESSAEMFSDCSRLQGAIAYDGSKTTHEYANYETGYFTKGCLHKDAAGNSTLVKKEDAPADCMTAAHTVYECSVCHRTVDADFTGEPDPTKHQLEKLLDAVAGTCVEYGHTAVYSCNVCHKTFDSEDATHEVLKEEDIQTPPLGHDFDDNYTCTRCGVTDLRYKALSLTGVKAVILDEDTPWKLTDETDATKGLMSGNKGEDSSESTMKIMLVSDKNFKADFGYKVSSERKYDKLYIESEKEDLELSGDQEASKTYYFSAGTHTITFQYIKDSGDSDGDDTAWLISFSATNELTADDLKNSIRPVVVYNFADNSLTWKAFGMDDVAKDEEAVFDIDCDDDGSLDFGPNPWSDAADRAESARIDESFSQFRPKSIAFWFCQLGADHIDGLQYLNTSETQNFAYAFVQSSVKTLDLSSFDTSKGITFACMFAGCVGLQELDLTSFDMSSAEFTAQMFISCVSLDKIYVNKHFDISAISNEYSNGMFANCLFLSGGKEYDPYFIDGTMANYHDGYLSTYYKVGDKRFTLNGDMTVDELTLEDGKPFMTHDAFTAKKATLKRTLADDNVKNIGTVCLPYAIKADGKYTLYAVKNVGDTDMPTTGKKAADDNKLATLYLEKISGELPAGTPAIFKANTNVVEFNANDADVVEQPSDDETLARDGHLLRGAFTEYTIEPENYVLSGDAFVRASSLTDDDTSITGAPLTACLTALSGYGIDADRLVMESDDNVITAVNLVENLANGKAEIFDINGTKLSTLKSGVNIIRHANGKTQKVVVK